MGVFTESTGNWWQAEFVSDNRTDRDHRTGKMIEDISKNKLIDMLPEDFRDEYREILFFEENNIEYRTLVKAADKISAHIKCIEEVKSGNSEFLAAKKATCESILSMNLPEATYFMENFIPPFECSLDELGGLWFLT